MLNRVKIDNTIYILPKYMICWLKISIAWWYCAKQRNNTNRLKIQDFYGANPKKKHWLWRCKQAAKKNGAQEGRERERERKRKKNVLKSRILTIVIIYCKCYCSIIYFMSMTTTIMVRIVRVIHTQQLNHSHLQIICISFGCSMFRLSTSFFYSFAQSF